MLLLRVGPLDDASIVQGWACVSGAPGQQLRPADMLPSGGFVLSDYPRRLSTQTHLLALVAAVVLPLLAFAAFLLIGYASNERSRFDSDAAQIARNIGLVIDGELSGLIALLKGVASSSALASEDFDVFHTEAKRLVQRGDEVIVLRDLGSRQILNTQRPRGEALPPAIPLSRTEQEAFAAGRAIVSDVYASPISGEARIAVALPIARDGVPVYVLALTVPTSRVRDALLLAVPNGWISGVGDRNGSYVSRSTRHEEVTGKPGVPEYLAKAEGTSGTFTSFSLEGAASLAGYYRSEFSGWLFTANIPKDVVEAPLWRSLTVLGLLGGAAVLLSGLLAYLFGTSFTAAATGLAERAAALGEGRPVLPVRSRLTEFAVVGDALATAAAAVERRTRELEIVLSTVPAAVLFTYDPEVRRVVRNRFAASLLRVPQDETNPLPSAGGVLEHVRLLKDGRVLEGKEMPLRRAMQGARIDEEEYTYQFNDGTSRTLLTSAAALRADDGAIVGAVSVSLDISERKRSEEQRQLLINELNHRVKNTLATVQSIALQTLRGAASIPDAQAALTDRLIALAKAHDVLTRESWEGAELHDIVLDAIAPHGGRDRFVVNGPPVRLAPSLSLTLALAFHELATNAVKYGALSAEAGTVRISWEVKDDIIEQKVRVWWVERGGPTVQAPTRKGFGSRLLERGFSAELDGAAAVDYAPEGVIWRIEAPIGLRTAEADKLTRVSAGERPPLARE
jgi:two-component sensor histidine kinase/PAS domain-containing protein